MEETTQVAEAMSVAEKAQTVMEEAQIVEALLQVEALEIKR